MQVKNMYTVTDQSGYETTFTHIHHDKVMMLWDMAKAARPYNMKVVTIKLVRDALGIGLKDAKYFVEDAWKY